MSPPACRRCGHLALCDRCLDDPAFEFEEAAADLAALLDAIREGGQDLGGDWCRPINRVGRPSTYRVQTVTPSEAFL